MKQPGKPQKKMSREDAVQLYNELQKSMTDLLTKQPVDAKPATSEGMIKKLASQLASEKKHSLKSQTPPKESAFKAPLTFLLACVALKAATAVIDYSGALDSTPAYATANMQSRVDMRSDLPADLYDSFDARRVELDDRSKRVSEKEEDLERKDKEFVIKSAEIKELTSRLKLERDQNEKKKVGQLDQLANVYGSMNPQESADLIGQLDISIALQLLQRMPEKRMGQILPLMKPERALAITKMLSGRN